MDVFLGELELLYCAVYIDFKIQPIQEGFSKEDFAPCPYTCLPTPTLKIF